MTRTILIAFCLLCAGQPAFAGERGYLGVWFGPLPAEEKAIQTGVVVKKVFAGMAGQRAGLKPGEIVTQINGVSVHDPRDGVALLSENAAGEKIRLTVINRTGDDIHRSYVFATMGDHPTSEFAEIMVVPNKPKRALATSSAGRHCSGSASRQDRSCRADVAGER